MYKTHLGEWELAKNYTEKRVKSLLHQKKERNAVRKVPQFAKEGKAVDRQRIAKYLKRKKKTVEEFCDVGMPTSSLPPRSLLGPDVHPNLAHSQPPFSPQPSAGGSYESHCPYRPWAKKFRLIEEFPEYVFYPESTMYRWLTPLGAWCTKGTRSDTTHTSMWTRRDHAHRTAYVASPKDRTLLPLWCINTQPK